MDSAGQSPGLLESLRRLADNGLAMVHNRAQLLAIELQEEKAHIMEVFLWVAVLLFFGISCVLVLTATIIWLFPEKIRIYLAGAFGLLYLLGTAWAFAGLRKKLQGPIPFTQTINEVKKDCESLWQ